MSFVLLLDVGNTQTEIAVFDQEQKISSWRLSSKLFSTEDEIASMIRNFFKFKNLEFSDIHDLGISSVVPELSFVLERFGQKYFNLAPLFVSSDVKLPITIDYQNPENVGADRICAAVAAYEKYKGASIIVDFGTATTFDVVHSKGSYLGGVISLGIEEMVSALHSKASKLPKVSYDIPNKYMGKNTEQSIQSGVFLGHIEMVKGILEKLKNELKNDPVKIVATGGIAPLVKPYIKSIHDLEPDLILNGLSLILKMNR